MRSLKAPIGAALRNARIALPARRGPAARATAPLAVAGFFTTASGIGEAARRSADALEGLGLAPVRLDISEALNQRDLAGAPIAALPAGRTGALLLHANAPETAPALLAAGMTRGRGWRVIGCWNWELEAPPPDWPRAQRFLTEVFASSHFTAAALAPHLSIPVRVAPIPVAAPARIEAPAPVEAQRAHGDFLCVVFADGRSSLARKNPAAAIRAFRLAFGDRPGRRLIVKTRNLAGSAQADDLRAAADGSAAIRFFDGTITEAERWALIKAADAVISLHRSEGFGLTLAEAMAIGKPTIATAWSANLDFMTEENSLLVPCTLVPVKDPGGPYEGLPGRWAEPDTGAAAAMLRQLAEHPARAREIGEKARTTIARTLTPEAHAAAFLKGR